MLTAFQEMMLALDCVDGCDFDETAPVLDLPSRTWDDPEQQLAIQCRTCGAVATWSRGKDQHPTAQTPRPKRFGWEA
jgi:hypothetical protein